MFMKLFLTGDMADMSEIVQKTEELSIVFVMADLSDLQTLADIYRRFEELSTVASKESYDLIARAASAASKLIEKVILNEINDKDTVFEIISQTVSSIQAIAVHKRENHEVNFPEELGISISDNQSASSDESIITDEIENEKIIINENAESKSPETSQQNSLFGDPGLVADFINEAREHLNEADVKLLTLENDPKNDDALNAVYRSFHTIKGVAGFLNLKDITTLAHATEDLLDRARKGEILLVGSPIDVTFIAVDSLKEMISGVESALSSGKPLVHNISLPELLSEIKSAASGEKLASDEIVENSAKGEVSSTYIEKTNDRQEDKQQIETPKENEKKALLIEPEIVENFPQRETKLEKASETGEAKSSTDREEAQEKQQTKSSTIGIVKETLKIEAERLDKLVDMIGELVIAESMVTQDTEVMDKASARVARNLAHLNKITRELQEIGMSLRMMPVRPVFERMARLARDLAKKSKKKIEFSMSGEDTEIDKSVVEKISDPLTHMIRNSVDHGIESNSDERIRLGKSEAGHIALRAFHKSGDIIIEIEDDGKGLDKEAILAKAKERGIIEEGQSLTDQEIYNLIFMPGFSTAKIVTDVSGRGVGMDVVNRNVQSLRGQIDIHSIQNKGTTFALRLPLTLAIMDGIIVQVGLEQYIIPTLSVVESIRPKREEISTIMGDAEMLCIRGKLLPMFRISSLFQLNNSVEDPTEALVVIVEDEGKKVGFMVDSLVGHQQIVIKSLGESMGHLKGISGGAIMADGQVGLILDVAGIVKLAVAGTVMAA
jgi:two-component system, chemotaxis family, sensor kinase CheA